MTGAAFCWGLVAVLIVPIMGCGGAGHGHQGGTGGEQEHDHMHHRFDDAERWAKVFDDPERYRWQRPEHVVELLLLEPGMTVADLGAGTGYFLPYLSSAAAQVIALDIEPNLVAYMQHRVVRDKLANVDVRLVAPDDPRLPDGSVDRILVVDTWHHLEDRVAYTRKLMRALRPGGFILVVDFTRESPMGPPVAERLSPEQVARELGQAGLAAEVVSSDLPDQYVVSGTLKVTP